MRLGIILSPLDTWKFFYDILEDLRTHYEVDVFHFDSIESPIFYERINRSLFHHKLLRFMKAHDVVFFEWASDWLSYATQYPKECKIITRLHSFELFEWAPKINWDNVDKVIFVSDVMRQRFSELYPDHIHKAEVVYNGVLLNKYKPPQQRIFNFNLGMLCSIKPVKRVYESILMIHSLINEQGYNVHLHIAGAPEGDKRYAAAVNRLVDKLSLEDAVHFYGHVSDSSAWLDQIDIFISNSYWEGQQVALLEAMAAGCLCLSHFWDGVEEILPQEDICESDFELLNKIIEYCNMSEKEKLAKQNSMRSIACKKFDSERQKAEIRTIIDELGET